MTEREHIKKLDEILSEVFLNLGQSLQGKKVGVLFSGGIDSSVIAIYAKKHGLNPTLYTFGVANAKDRDFAERCAKDLDIPFKFIEITEREIEDSHNFIEKSLEKIEYDVNPMQIALAMGVYLAGKKIAENKVDVVLSGQGADELFAGPHRYGELNDEDLQKRMVHDARTAPQTDMRRDASMTELSGVKMMFPFSDKDFVDVSLDIPISYKIKNGERKYIFRRLGDYVGLPGYIVDRKRAAMQYSSGVQRVVTRFSRKEKSYNKVMEDIILEAAKKDIHNKSDFISLIKENLRGQNIADFPSSIMLRRKYRELSKSGKIESSKSLENLLVTKKMRSLSGVSIITVLTKPWSCPGECVYCPTEVDVPKSYLSNEPAVMRAILCDYDPARQIKARLNSLGLEGHPTDKIELIVIGGTFSSLSRDYQEEYIRQCYIALNDQPQSGNIESGISSLELESRIKNQGGNSNSKFKILNTKFSLADAKKANESAKHRCVGLTLETRPDYITQKEVEWFRYLGATRVELGVQSVFDGVLELNKRGHKVAETVRATKLLKDAGFKICYHMMPNLPGSDLEKDLEMFRVIFTDERFQPDYVKIYPCVVTKGSELYKWWKAGKYQPYSDKELENLICEIKKITPYHVRIMRLIRDIPSSSIEAGSKVSNMRQNVQKRLVKEGESCKCIRCREAGLQNKNEKLKIKKADLFTEEYEASDGKEVFLSYESKDRRTLTALLRFRLPGRTFIKELEGCTLIRELHTYGQQIEIGKEGKTQHQGLGKKLIIEAEELAKKNGYEKIAVISGVGVRDYYRNLGYELVGEYMVKDL